MVGPDLMQKRKAFELKNVTRIYNVYQICSCFFIIISFYKNGFSTWDSFSHTNDIPDEIFKRILKVWYFGLSVRMAELSETVIFVLRKKQNQVSFLHLYHHVGTIFGVWITLKYDASEFL